LVFVVGAAVVFFVVIVGGILFCFWLMVLLEVELDVDWEFCVEVV